MVPEAYPTFCYCWGSAGGNALGAETKSVLVRPKLFDLKRRDVSAIFAGDRRAIALTRNGEAYSWGSDPLGRKCVTNASKSVGKKINTINAPIKKISHGNNHTACLCRNGRVFCFGDATDGKLGLKNKQKGRIDLPRVVDLDAPVVDIACGLSFTTLLLENGQILTHGLTGLDLARRAKSPFKIDLSVKITSIACGTSHCAAISTDGRIYTWGSSGHGRLGNGRDDGEGSVANPSCVEYFCNEGIVVTKVACGFAHTLVISEDGELYSFGWNYYFQCGTEGDREQGLVFPSKVYGHFNVSTISCGFAHSAFTTKDGKLYTFGFNEDSQLGIGHETNTANPTMVTFDGAKTHCVVDVSCGHLHTVALVAFCKMSEFFQRLQQIEVMKNAIRKLQIFARYVLFHLRLRKVSKKQNVRNECFGNGHADSDSMRGKSARYEDVDDSSGSSVGSIECTMCASEVIDASPKHSYRSNISEIMSMEAEEDLSSEISRKLNISTKQSQNNKKRFFTKILKRHDIQQMQEEDVISTIKRDLQIAVNRRLQRQRELEKIQKKNELAQERIKRTALRSLESKNEGTALISRPKAKRKRVKIKKNANITRKNKAAQSSVSLPKVPALPSKGKNKKLLRQRQERLIRQEREKLEEEERQRRLKCEEEQRLLIIKNRQKERFLKAQKLKPLLKANRRKSKSQFPLLHKKREDSKSLSLNDDEVSHEFKTVREWSRNIVGDID